MIARRTGTLGTRAVALAFGRRHARAIDLNRNN